MEIPKPETQVSNPSSTTKCLLGRYIVAASKFPYIVGTRYRLIVALIIVLDVLFTHVQYLNVLNSHLLWQLPHKWNFDLFIRSFFEITYIHTEQTYFLPHILLHLHIKSNKIAVRRKKSHFGKIIFRRIRGGTLHSKTFFFFKFSFICFS